MGNAVSLMLFCLGAVPLALSLVGGYPGVAATVVGISAVTLDFIVHRPTKLVIGKVVGFVFAAIAVLCALGTFA